jgi:tRNA(Arg) A34 adenosine deaminase TadA
LSHDRFPNLQVSLPAWLVEFVPADDHRYEDDEAKMRLVLDLARENVRRGAGGPFGAAVFDGDSGRLIAPGVNLVVHTKWSGAHAEMVAIAVAQQRMGTFDLGADGMSRMELVTSTEPCSMCLGATFWTGVRRLVCGARGEDAEAIGFDEGPKPAAWVAELERRGIAVSRDVLRDEGRAVLEAYRDAGGVIYNSRGADAE